MGYEMSAQDGKRNRQASNCCGLLIALGTVLPVMGTSVFAQTQIASRYQAGADLQAVVALLQQQSLSQTGVPGYEQAYRELVVAQDVTQKGKNPREVEYDVIRKLLAKSGDRSGTLMTADEYQAYRQRERPVVEASPASFGIAQVRVPVLEPGVASQVRQALYTVPYDRGLILDLRNSAGDDPQTAADVARLFFPTSISPLLQTTGLGERVSNWDSTQRPIAGETPLVVLVNQSTMGGAQALAAQLASTSRAQVIGTATGGQDLRREIFTLPSGAAVRLVVGRWRIGDGRTLGEGVAGEATKDPVATAIASLDARPRTPLSPTIFPSQGTIGKYKLGFDAGTGDLGIPGSFESFGGKDGNTLRPMDELKIWFVPDYTVFTYKPRSSVFNFYADRIYTSASDAATDLGIRVGSSYNEVIQAYGRPGQNGYNEIGPFPTKSRGERTDRYHINYDALGVSFALEAGTNLVKAIGIYKPGS